MRVLLGKGSHFLSANRLASIRVMCGISVGQTHAHIAHTHTHTGLDSHHKSLRTPGNIGCKPGIKLQLASGTLASGESLSDSCIPIQCPTVDSGKSWYENWWGKMKYPHTRPQGKNLWRFGPDCWDLGERKNADVNHTLAHTLFSTF